MCNWITAWFENLAPSPKSLIWSVIRTATQIISDWRSLLSIWTDGLCMRWHSGSAISSVNSQQEKLILSSCFHFSTFSTPVSSKADIKVRQTRHSRLPTGMHVSLCRSLTFFWVFLCLSPSACMHIWVMTCVWCILCEGGCSIIERVQTLCDLYQNEILSAF